MTEPGIFANDFTYDLPEARIAMQPVEPRDHSKLLIYKSGVIAHDQFFQIHMHLPQNSLVVFNDTKVIPARLYFERQSGARIEIFLDKPLSPSVDPLVTLSSTESCSWKCIVGNKKKWKDGEILRSQLLIENNQMVISAEWEDRENQIVKFTWEGGTSFAKMLEQIGHTPLPPYIHREDIEIDKANYQTVYSKNEGAVAAPTAGLHFTDNVLEAMSKIGSKMDFLTLHVGGGTFQPIKVDDVREHNMHSERMVIKKSNVENLLNHDGPVIPVGTTAMRSLESLYWYGVKLLQETDDRFFVEKLSPYEVDKNISSKSSLEAVLKYMAKEGKDEIQGETEIFIFPGYKFRICDGLITNFHQPGTTLILLVAALIGEDWRKIYTSALENDYRFLSYGDSSLLLPNFT